MIVIGINHKTAPVDVRERFSFTRKHLAEALAEFKDSGLVHGAVILSTCNRVEVLAITSDIEKGTWQIKKFLA